MPYTSSNGSDSNRDVPLSLIEQTSRRLLNQRRANILGFFLPLMLVTGVSCSLVLSFFSLPPSFSFVSLVLPTAFMIHNLVKAKNTIRRDAVASLLDEKTDGQERFLTYATLPQDQANQLFFSILQRQAVRKSSSFVPSHDLPFTLEKRVPIALAAAVLSILVLLFLPSTPISSFFAPQPVNEMVLANLEQVGRSLLKGVTRQEHAAGAQLLALVEELKNPTLSPQEKQRLIEEAQQKITLPLPQLLPFDLQMFTSESKNDRGSGNQSDQPQSDNSPLAKSQQNQEQIKKSSSAAAGHKQYPGPSEGGEKKEQSRPRESGGGIQFNFPQSQSGERKEQTGNEPSGQQQQAAQDQVPNNQRPGTDPNRPGGRQDRNRGSAQDEQRPGSPQQQQQGTGTTLGGGAGERFLKPGEQPGGFLTKDAQYVKVRVPIGQRDEGGNKQTESRGGALPKTPYSNVPLKEGPPDQPHLKQPIPLEYRTILQQ